MGADAQSAAPVRQVSGDDLRAIVTALWAFAGPRLLEILGDAIDSVQGPGGA